MSGEDVVIAAQTAMVTELSLTSGWGGEPIRAMIETAPPCLS